MLATDRRLACLLIARAKVEEWMADGPAEVARCLGVWMDRGFDLGDDCLTPAAPARTPWCFFFSATVSSFSKGKAMGMDLRPVNPPKYVSPMTCDGVVWDDEWKSGRYNIDGWSELLNYLHRKGFAEELSVFNDGEAISAADCREIADLLDQAEGEDSWLKEHASWWRTCGGCFVY